jgi:hypothetical protein
MTPREIVAEAWAITTRERVLWRWGFIDSFFATLLSIKFLSFQLYVFYEFFFGANEASMFAMEEWLIANTPPWFWISTFITFAVLLVVEFFMPHFTEGALIGLTVKAHRGEELKGGIVLALYNFFPMFATHELFAFSSWNMLLSVISLTLRYFPPGMYAFIISTAVGLWIFSNVFKFLAGFAEEACVIKKTGIFEGVLRSYKLMVSHLGKIMFLLLLLLVISVRILLNAVIFVLIPAIVVGIGLLLTSFLSPVMTYLVGSAIAVLLVGLVSYSLAYLHVFNVAVWTLMFLHLDAEKDLDTLE